MSDNQDWRKILVIEDDERCNKQIKDAFDSHSKKWKVSFVSTSKAAINKISQGKFDLILLSCELPDKSGPDFLRQLKSNPQINLPVILIAHDTSEEAREKAMQAGALDFVVRTPSSLSAMARIVIRNLAKFNLQREVATLRSKFERKEFLEHMMGNSDAIKAVHNAIERVAWTDFSVLIYGETGTGKEIIAQAIHEYSLRKDKPFVTLDCGAIPDTLMDSVMSGYRKGAFTGADQTHEGHFQKANGGTLFFDEISNVPKNLQRKLLRAIEERKIRKVGSTVEESIDVRFISSTNMPLEELVEKGEFRKDLYYRLNEYSIHVPSLRERKEDIPFLAKLFLQEVQKELRGERKQLSKETLDKLLDYNWPGNVRELQHVIRRAALVDKKIIKAADVPLESFEVGGMRIDFQKKFDLKEASSKFQKNIISQTLNKFGGNKLKTAKFLKIDYKTLLKKIKDYGLNN